MNDHLISNSCHGRCWNCSGCRRSRQDLVPVVTMWWWLWWRDLVLAHSGAGLPSTGVHLKCDADAKLMLNRAVVAHILCIDASSDVWWSALSSSGWSGLAEELQQSVFRSGPHAHDFTQHRASVMRRHQEMFGKNVSSSVHLRPPIRAKFVKQVSFADHQAAERTSLNGTEQSDAAQNLQPNALPSNGEQANSPKESATRIEAITDASGPTGVGDMSGRSAVEKELNDLASGGNWSVERQRILEQRLMGGEKPSASTWAIPTFPAAKSARVKLRKKLERDDEKVINLSASLASPIISRIAPLVVSDSEDCNSQNNAFQVGKKASSIPNVGPKKRPRSKIKPKDDHSATAAGKSSIEIKSKASGVQSSSRRRQPAAPRQKKASKAGKGKEDPEAMSTCLSERQQNSACLASPEVQIESISEQNLNSAKNSSLESIEKKTRCLRNRGGTVENGSVPPIEDYESGAANRRCEGNTGKEMSQNFPKSNCDVESTDAMLASQSIPCGQLVSSRRLSFSLQRKGDSNSLTNQNLSMNIDNCLDEILKPTDTDVRDVDQFSETSEDPLSPDIIPASSEYEISDLFIPKLFTTKSQSNFSGSANSPQNISSDKGISNVEERDQDSKTSVKRCEKLPEKSPLLSLSVTETQSVVSNSNAPENSFSKPLKNWDGSREDANNDETAFSNVNQSGSHERSGIREVGEVKDECKEETQDFLNEKSSFVPIVGNSRLRRKLAPAHRIACQDPGDSEGSLITESNPCYNHADREDFLTKRKKTSPEGVVCKIEKPDEATTRVLSARLLTTPSDRHPEEGSLTRSEGRLPDSTVISSPEIRDLNSVTDGGSGGRKQSKKRKKDLDDYDGPAINKNESGENENRKKTKSVKATSENVHSSFVAQGMAGIEGNMVTAKPSKKKKRNKSADEAPSLQPIPANKKNRYETSISHRDNDRKLGKNIEKPVQFSSSIIYSFDSVETDREQEMPKDSLKVKKAKTKKRGSGEHSGESCAALVQVSTPNSRAPEPRIVSVQEEWNSIFQQPTKPKVSSRERLENLASVESPLRPHQKSVEIYEAKTQIAKVSKKKTKRANEAPRELTNEEMIADFEKFALREYNCDLSKC
ncbi:hypothetical protein FHG87_019933 [Trinorchestia longiramus]|nr:hypothetical protein FHG87_019933 [Trinorchestia longiramus]